MARLLSFLDGFKDVFAYFFLRTMFPIVCQAQIFLIFILHRCAKGLMRSFAWQKNKPDSRGQLAVINVSSFGFEVWISFGNSNNYRFWLLVWNPGMMLF